MNNRLICVCEWVVHERRYCILFNEKWFENAQSSTKYKERSFLRTIDSCAV